MKRRIWTLALALAASTVAAQFVTTYRDKDQNLSAVGPGGGSVNYKVGGQTTITLRGTAAAKAKISSVDQGLSIEATAITAQVLAASERQARSRIQSATATGGVEIVKDVVANGARQRSQIRAGSATYAAGSVEGKLTLAGNVTINNLNEAQKQTSVVTGRDGTILLDPDQIGNEAIRNATLSGPVKVTVVEAPQKPGAPTNNFVATGDRLVFNNTAKPATVTLTGNVKIAGTGEQVFETQGANKATIFLNERGEMTEYELTSDTTATTTIRNPGGKR